jgi:hypothetical protein
MRVEAYDAVVRFVVVVACVAVERCASNHVARAVPPAEREAGARHK